MSVNVLISEDLRSRRFSLDMVVLARVIRRTHKRLPTRVLVVGCGNGRDAAQLAVSLDADVTGVDLRSRFDVDAARFATLRTGNPGALEFADGAFDFIYSQLGFSDVSGLRASLYQMSRVLAHGGGFCLRLPARSGLTPPGLRSELIAAFGEAADVTNSYYQDRYRDAPGAAKWFWRTSLGSALLSSRYFVGRRAAREAERPLVKRRSLLR